MTDKSNKDRLEFEEMVTLSDPNFAIDESEFTEKKAGQADQTFKTMKKLNGSKENMERWEHFFNLRSNYRAPEFSEENWVDSEAIAKQILLGWWQLLSERWKNYFQQQEERLTKSFQDLLKGPLQPAFQARGAEATEETSFFGYISGLEGSPNPTITEDGVCCDVFQNERCRIMIQLPEDGYVSIVMLSEEDTESPKLFFPQSKDDLQSQAKGLRNLFDYKFYVEGQLRMLVYFSEQPWSELIPGLDLETWSKDNDSKILEYLRSEWNTLESVILNLTIHPK